MAKREPRKKSAQATPPSNQRPRRPKVIDVRSEDTLAYVADLAARGMYEKHIAACLGYNAQYFVQLKKLHPELAEALRVGAACGIERVTGALMDEVDARNTTAMIFYLKAKAGWRDNALTVDDDGATGDPESVGRSILDDVRRVRGSGRRDPR